MKYSWPKKFKLHVLFLIFLSLLTLYNGVAGIPDSTNIKSYAGNFLNSRLAGRKNVDNSELRQVYISDDTCTNRLYGFKVESGGYVFVMAVDTSLIVPAYSLTGNFDPNTASPALKAFLGAYESSQPVISEEKAPLPLTKGSVSPLLEIESINWNQIGAYNDACPWDVEANKHALAGCVAVAMAQIMRFHKYPATGTGSHSYNHPKYETLTVDFGSTTYNWNNMPGTSATSDVANLLYHAGVSVDMNYTPSESGASSALVAPALTNFFGYPNPFYADPDNFAFGTNEYQIVLREELNNNRPFYYEVTGDPGHAVVCDGYNDDYFHMNFGWGGYENGYFLISDIKFIGGYLFGFKGSAVIGISPVPITVNKQDSLALVALYNSAGGPNWYYKDNWLTGRVSSWQNVDVINGRVVHLTLTGNNLKGTIPTEIGNLTALTNLSIAGNYQLAGSIPSSIGQLTNLLNLSFGANALTGTIPVEIGNCKDLIMLSFGGNKLSGSIPPSIGQLTSLEYLNLGNNQLIDQIPNEIINLAALKNLNLSRNLLTGTLHENIGNLTLLKDLQINYNQLSGQLPESIWNLTNLEMFAIDNNKFEGALSSGIGGFTKLILLKLDNNSFTVLPPEIGQLINLSNLSAVNNKLSGILPSTIGALTALKYIYLDNNQLIGLPKEIGLLTGLEELHFANNLIESLPPELGGLTSLTNLDLSNNLIVELPYELSSLVKLTNLLVSHNQISEITFGLSMMGKLNQAEFSYNRLSNPLPPLEHMGLLRFNIDHNNLTFEDIASSKLPDDINYTDNYDFFYRYQGSIKFSKDKVEFSVNDSIGIDVKSVTDLSHPENIYTWFKNGNEFSTGPLLMIKNATAADQGNYYCSIENNLYTKLIITTDTLNISIVQPGSEQAADTIVSKTGSPLHIADEKVKLVKPTGLRGIVVWQSSLDSINWINLSGTITNPDINQNISNIYADSIIVNPVRAALYRYKITEGECEPVFSDTLLIGPFLSKLLIDTLLNVDNASATVTLENIEIFIPKNLTTGDFSLSVNLIETPPAIPDTVISGPVYDVKLSCGSSFTMPITVKMKVFSDSLTSVNLERFITAYHDDKEYKWVPYESSSISMRDSSISFETDHLTKLSYWEKKWVGSNFSDKFERDSVIVYYQDKFSYLTPLYDANQSAKPWHLAPTHPEYGTPLMVQDVAQFTLEVMRKFKLLGLSVPRSITIYVDNISDYGEVGLLGMTNGYMTISLHIDDPDLLRSVIAHEYMHYTQDYYILAHPGNIFWMEANGHTADRMVWGTSTLPVSESDSYLMDNRKGKQSMFQSLSDSWDHWDSGLLTQNLFGNVDYCYLAGTFIHYMRSYRSGTKLKPETLLKETPMTGSWKDYLNSYTGTYLSSTIGKEYEGFVKYIVSGINPGFTLLNNDPQASGDPMRFLNQAPDEFSNKHLYKIPEDETAVTPIVETIGARMPHLSSKMEQFYNLSLNRSLCVSYKRMHSDTTNMKVYLGIWNDVTKRIDLTDISRKDSSFFFIKAASPENVSVKSHQAFLLFINKSDELSIMAEYELEILPVADFNFLYTLDFSYNNVIDAPIHTFTDGINKRILMVFNSDASSLSKVYTDSTFTTTVSDGIRTQQVYYNFRNGDLTLSEDKAKSGPVQFDPNGCIYNYETETTVIKLKDIFLVPFASQFVSQSGIYYTQTTSTSETQSKVVSISNTYTSTCDLAGGGTSVTTYSYTGTNWNTSPGIRINLQFK